MIRLVLLRKKHNLTQRKLAQLLGCSYSFISMLESGQRTPNSEITEKLAGFFGVSPEYLLGLDEANKQNEHANELLEVFQSLEPQEKQELLDFAYYLTHKRKLHTNL